MAPEVLSRANVDAGPAIDIWALGVMLYTMVIGELPFDGETEEEIEDQIVKKKLKFKNTKPISNEIKDLLSLMLTKDPTKRITMFELQSHPWMDLGDDDLLDSIEKSKQEEEEEKKKDDEPDDDLEYLASLKLDDKIHSAAQLEPKSALFGKSIKKGASPRGGSPKTGKGTVLNGSIKKKKTVKKKSKKVAK
jgi:serine/threonine protein kinase